MNVLSHFPNFIFPSEVLLYAINYLLILFGMTGWGEAPLFGMTGWGGVHPPTSFSPATSRNI